MKKILVLALTSLTFLGLVGCGGSSSSTVLSGTITGETGTLTGASLKAVNSDEGYSEELDIDSDGTFSLSKVPEGIATIRIESSDEATTLEFGVDMESNKTTEVEVHVMTWDPEGVAEYRVMADGDSSFGSYLPLGPTGTTMSTDTSGGRVFETAKGLLVTRDSDGDVTVDSTNYTP